MELLADMPRGEDPTAPTAEPASKKRGRKPSKFWVSFTTAEEPYKARSAPCRHCHNQVNYHKKWEQAKSHLMKCEPFLRTIQATDPSAHPEWFIQELEKRRRLKSSRLFPLEMLPPSATTTSAQTDDRSSTWVATSKNTQQQHGQPVPPVDALTLERAELWALSILVAPSDAKLAWSLFQRGRGIEGDDDESAQLLLDRCHARVRRSIDAEVLAHTDHATTTPRPVIAVSWEPRFQVLVHSLVVGDKTFFLDRRQSDPLRFIEDETTRTSDSGALLASWIHEEIVRIHQMYPSVHDFILDMHTELARSILALHIPSEAGDGQRRLFTSPRRVLLGLIEELLTGDEAENPLRSAPVVALSCRDLLTLAGLRRAREHKASSDYPWSDTTIRVDGVRCIELDEVFEVLMESSLLSDSTKFLELVSKRKLFGRNESNQADAVKDVLESADFRMTLQKLLSVVQPLHSALEVLSQRQLCRSVIQPTFARLFEKSASDLTDAERTFICNRIDACLKMSTRTEHNLAHLLDPVHVGEFMTSEAKQLLEQQLVVDADLHLVDASSSHDADQKLEELYVQYTEYQIAALQQKEDKSSFVYRMLSERKKTALQYWLTDGRRWPRLQRVALNVLQTPADVGGVMPMGQEALNKSDELELESRKEFILRNASQFNVATLAPVDSLPDSTFQQPRQDENSHSFLM